MNDTQKPDFPDSITVRVTHNDKPVADLAVNLVFLAQHKNDFTTLPLLTDHDGQVVFDRQRLESDIENLTELFPRNYGIFGKHTTGEVQAVIWGERDVDWALKAHELLADRTTYPGDYVNSLERALKALNRLEDADVNVDVQITDGEQFQAQAVPLTNYRHRPSPERLLLPERPDP